jgi:hypothetical protein
MTAPVLTRTGRPLIGAVVIAISVLAAAWAVLTAVIPPAVEPDVWSYPFATAPFIAGQVFIAVHHLVLAAGLLVAWRIGLAGSSRFAAVTGILATAAMVLFAAVELVGAGAAGEVGSTPLVDIVGSLYGAATIVLAVTSILFGVAIVRARAWSGLTRFTVLVTGIYLLVPLVPAQFGPFLVRMIALLVWTLLYIGLGVGLRRGALR